ncbi:MAG: VWA domain-containing protein [Verrucomicrobiales bacterium]
MAGWFYPRLGLFRPLRLLCVLLLGWALSRPQVRKFEDGLDLWVLLDRSDSTEGIVDKSWPEWQRLLERGRRSGNDRLIQLDYAAEVLRHGETGAELYDRNRRLTRTRLAVESALAMASPTKPARILLFTDGFSTEPLDGLAEKLVRQNVSLDYRLVRDPATNDYRLSRLSLPERAQLAEPFLIEIEVRGPRDGKVPLVIRRNDHEVKRAEVTVHRGLGTLRFTDRISLSGAHRYEALIQPPQQDRLGNNRFEAWIEISGGPRVLLVTKYLNDPVSETLRKQGFVVETVTLPAPPTLGQLAGAKAVILNNVPAFDLPNDFLNSLSFYVREQGGSLMMTGGRQSFGAGGYFESPVDSLLPVSMEMKIEHRKLSVAMAIVMDRSGSMGMNVAPGMQKMDLANEGAANAIRYLGAEDLITVYAVDSEAHEMVPLQKVGANREKMAGAVRRIQSMGGGIFVYEGLKAAWEALRKSDFGQRHIILFSDAADSEQPGAYIALLDEITANGGTVSVIALGTRADADANLLEDIATRGKGRLFFTDKAAELPSIFSQETVAVARSAFIIEFTGAKGAGGWFEISAQPMDWLAGVDGYNLSYAREWASQALIATDEYAAPLVAFGQRGLGRTAAVSFALGGEHSQSVRAWPKYGDFLQTLTRWLMGDEAPPGLGLRHNLRGTTLDLDLLYDAAWEQKLSEKAPRILIASGPRADTTRELTWRRMAPGHFHAEVELSEGELVRGAVQVGPHALTLGPILVGTSAEWAFEGARLDELKQASASSGGGELLDLERAWRNPPTKQYADIQHWFFVAALLSILIEALVTRAGWRVPVLALPKFASRRAPRVHRPARDHLRRLQPDVIAPSESSSPPIEDIASPGNEDAIQRQQRYARAKRG